jgi:hypothetical protein
MSDVLKFPQRKEPWVYAPGKCPWCEDGVDRPNGIVNGLRTHGVNLPNPMADGVIGVVFICLRESAVYGHPVEAQP